MRNAIVALLLVGCAESTLGSDSGARVHRQDACASLLRAHESRGCDLSSWVCPFVLDGDALDSSDVYQCEQALLSLAACDVPSCESRDR